MHNTRSNPAGSVDLMEPRTPHPLSSADAARICADHTDIGLTIQVCDGVAYVQPGCPVSTMAEARILREMFRATTDVRWHDAQVTR